MSFAVLNGQILPSEEVLISPEDRGFRFGDGVFETIRITRGQPYLWQDHLERLEAGLSVLRIAVDISPFRSLATQLIEKNEVAEGLLRIAISRGVGSRGYVPMPEPDATPTRYMTAMRVAMEHASPRHLLVSRYRKTDPLSLPTHFKLANGLNSVLAVMEARDQGFSDALMLDAEGNIAESTNANIFWQKNGMIFTPGTETGCLSGVMRKRFLALHPDIIQVREPLQSLIEADAAVLTNSAAYVIPVQGIYGHGTAFDSAGLCETWLALIEKDIEQQMRAKR